MSSPPASPGSFPGGVASTRDGWAGGSIAEGGSRAGAAPASSPAAPPPSVARSDVSRLSADSHHSLHSIYSQRSRWSTAATLGGTSTVAQRLAPELPLEPAEPLPEEMSGGSSTISGEVEAVDLQQVGPRGRRAAGSAAAALAASSMHSSGGGSRLSAPARVAALQGAAGVPGSPAASPVSAGDHGTADARLPPRLIIFHPDGQTFSIGVDKLREHELQRAAEAAAAQRRRQQQREAAAAVGSGAAGDAVASAPGSREEGFDENYPGWRQLYAKQKHILAGVLVLDMIYLVVLLILRLVWGDDSTDPSLSGAAQFFVGSHPQSTSVSYLAGSLFTDFVALYGTIQNYASIITLFIVWSVILGAFAILEMPLLFIIIRLVLLVAAFQLRFSMARLRNMLPPTSLGMYLSATGRGMAATGSAAWASATRPFRRRSQPAPTGPGTPPAVFVRRRTSNSPATGVPVSPTAPASPVAAARSSALFRAALMRMMNEQRRAEFEHDLELGSPQRQPQPEPQLGASEAGGPLPSSSPAPGGASRPARLPSRRASSASGAGIAAAARAAATAEPGSGPGQDPATNDSLGRLYSQIMEDIAAVAAAPSTASERRRHRRRERQRRSQQLAAAMSASRQSGSDGQLAAAAQAAPADGSSQDDGSDRERSAASPAARSSRRARSSSRLQRSEAAISAATAAGTQARAGASADASQEPAAMPSGPPSWAELMALLNFHSEQQQLRRQRNVDVVPLVSLTAPPPAAEDRPDDAGSSGSGAPDPGFRQGSRQRG